MKNKQNEHGGYRPGAGRKANSGKFNEPTQSVRIPLSALNHVNAWLQNLLTNSETQNGHPPALPSIPFYECSVSAGFPSPADDKISSSLDLNTHLISTPAATFFVHASGDSMLGVGIHSGDLLIVDRSLTAKNQDIVIAILNGDLTVKRLVYQKGQSFLKAENPDFEDIFLSDDMVVTIWGVVTNVIHRLRH